MLVRGRVEAELSKRMLMAFVAVAYGWRYQHIGHFEAHHKLAVRHRLKRTPTHIHTHTHTSVKYVNALDVNM